MGLEMVSSGVSVIRTGILGGWKYIGFVYPISPKPQTLNPPPPILYSTGVKGEGKHSTKTQFRSGPSTLEVGGGALIGGFRKLGILI